MSTVRSIQVDKPDGELRLGERDVPAPGPGHVRVTVEACGVCHSDAAFVGNVLPGLSFPLTPGHEVSGRIESLGQGVVSWNVGDRVAIGWFGGHCTYCDACRSGDAFHCQNAQIPGLSYPGGYAEALVVPANALARIPDDLTSVEAAPLACAGATTFDSLRRSGARAGDTVAILGLGGLGHLGVQFAAKMGFRTVVIARGQEKAAFAGSLGAHHYIDSTSQDVSAELVRLGGARVVLATTSGSSEAITATVDGLATGGELIVLGVIPEPMAISPLQLIPQAKVVYGRGSGTAKDIDDTLAFAALTGVRAIVEEAPIEDANAAYQRMLANQARFRMVLTTGK